MPISLSQIKYNLKRITNPLLDFIYPPLCKGCSTHIDPEDVLCAECMADLVEYEWDVQHSQKLLDEMHVPVQASELRVGFVFENDSVLQRCIHAMKYQGMYSIGFWFGRLLGERLVETSMIENNPILIPVPLNKLKQYERGYNQSEWISKGIAFETGLQFLTNGLVRTRYTKSQAQSKLHADERKSNVKDAFIVGANLKDQIFKKVIILVDDLITTGATTGECIDELLIAGASEVRVVGLAMPQKKINLTKAL